jgi:hypothetical protein
LNNLFKMIKDIINYRKKAIKYSESFSQYVDISSSQYVDIFYSNCEENSE